MERLKELRKERNLLQKDVAKLINVGRTTYVKYENGDSEPSLKTLIELANYFDVSIDYLLEVTDERKPSSRSLEHSRSGLSREEREIVKAYREFPEMRYAVKKLLGITRWYF